MFGTYGEVLRIPGALRFSLAGLLARFPISVLSIGIVMFIQLETDSYGVAGAVAAVYLLVQAAANPTIARLVDKYGQSRIMAPAVVVHLLALLVLLLAVWLDWWFGLVFATAGLAGLTTGSVGSFVKARWTYVIKRPSQVHTAFSWESVMDEVLFVTGPALVTLLATLVLPAAGVLFSMLATGVGSLLFYAQRGTEPPPRDRAEKRTGRVLRNPGIIILILTFLALGANFGAIDVAVVAFTDERGVPALAGVLLGAFAGGSLIAGAIYGARQWPGRNDQRFLIVVGALAVGTCTLVLSHEVWSLALTLFLVGFAIAPSLIGGTTAAQLLAPPGRLTEALSWVSTALGGGVAAGSALAGVIVDESGAQAALLVPAAATVLGAAVLFLGRRRLIPENVEN